MIRRVILRRFKRFNDVTFEIPGHIVLAGPNNTGKTTLLQAIASWCFSLETWRRLNDFARHGTGYTRAPIARQAFSSVPLRSFDLLWSERSYRRNHDPIEIEIQGDGWRLPMEFIADSTEQIYVRPTRNAEVGEFRKRPPFEAVYVPPMTGLSTDEPVYQAPKVKQLLGQGKPGDVIRNLLVEAYGNESGWRALQSSIDRLFGYRLSPPDSSGADIVAEYRMTENGPLLDIASAGSGFQQVLMLLTFLHTRPASVLLIDEPDAHLHIILQDAIYGELRSVAAQQNSQLIVATHSEVIIDSVEPRELCVLLDNPRQIADEQERTRLSEAMGVLQNTDIMQTRLADGVLYLEGHTDLAILREWARILQHPACETLTTKLFWKPVVDENRHGAAGVDCREHFRALQLVRNGFPGLRILDGDDNANIPDTPLTGRGLQTVRWRRYEIESYLIHPAALERFVRERVGEAAATPHIADLQEYFTANFPPPFFENPLGDYVFLNGTKARTDILPPALAAAGLFGIPYSSYHEIAALMTPDEIHPEVTEKLNAIQQAFGL